jgi:hypothetical protein
MAVKALQLLLFRHIKQRIEFDFAICRLVLALPHDKELGSEAKTVA